MRKHLSDRLHDYVSGLSNSEVREELEKAYLHMYRCTEVLRGQDVEPVCLNDNECISEELFYLCKKKGIEAAIAEDPHAFAVDYMDRISKCFNMPSIPIHAVGKIRQMKFSPGETVYYFNGCICHSVINEISYDGITGWEIKLDNGTVLKGFAGLFGSKKALENHLKNYLNGKK